MQLYSCPVPLKKCSAVCYTILTNWNFKKKLLRQLQVWEEIHAVSFSISSLLHSSRNFVTLTLYYFRRLSLKQKQEYTNHISFPEKYMAITFEILCQISKFSYIETVLASLCYVHISLCTSRLLASDFTLFLLLGIQFCNKRIQDFCDGTFFIVS